MPITAMLMRSLAPITEAYDLALSPKLPIAIPAVPKTLCLINSRLFVIVLDLCSSRFGSMQNAEAQYFRESRHRACPPPLAQNNTLRNHDYPKFRKWI